MRITQISCALLLLLLFVNNNFAQSQDNPLRSNQTQKRVVSQFSSQTGGQAQQPRSGLVPVRSTFENPNQQFQRQNSVNSKSAERTGLQQTSRGNQRQQPATVNFPPVPQQRIPSNAPQHSNRRFQLPPQNNNANAPVQRASIQPNFTVPSRNASPDGNSRAFHLAPIPNSGGPAVRTAEVQTDRYGNGVQLASYYQDVEPSEELAEIRKKIDELDIEEEQKKALIANVERAKAQLDIKTQNSQKVTKYRAEIESADQTIEDAKNNLKKNSDHFLDNKLENLNAEIRQFSIRKLESLQNKHQTRLDEDRAHRTKLEEQTKSQNKRRQEIAKLIAENTARLGELQKQKELAPPEGESATATRIGQIFSSAAIAATESQIELLKVESERFDALADYFPVQRDLINRDIALLEKEIPLIDLLLSQKRQEEVKALAVEARKQVEEAHPKIKKIAERNVELVEARTSTSKELESITRQERSADDKLQSIKTEYEDAQKKVAKAGHSSTIGLLLRKLRSNLPGDVRMRNKLYEIETHMMTANLEQIEFEDERDKLGLIESNVAQIMSEISGSIPAQGSFEYTDIETTVRKLFESQKSLLDSLIRDKNSYIKKLSSLEVDYREQLKLNAEIKEYVGGHVLWIRSDDPVGPRDINQAISGFAKIVQPNQWLELTQLCGLTVFRNPFIMLIAVLFFASLFVVQRQLRGKMLSLNETNPNSNITMWPSFRSLLIAAIVSAPWPLVLMVCGWRLNQYEPGQQLGRIGWKRADLRRRHFLGG